MSDEATTFYKRVRNRVALVLAVLWIGAWYTHLNAQRIEEIEAMQACKRGSGIRATACVGFDFVLPADVTSQAGMALSMVAVVLFSPLMLLPAGYVARRYVSTAAAREIRLEEAEQERRQRRLQQESVARMAQNDAAADAALRQISRSEVIHKLGAINDLTDLLQSEVDEERRMNIRHGVAQALRELAVKYTVPELAGLIQSDLAVAHTARAVVARLDASTLGTIVDIQPLRSALQS